MNISDILSKISEQNILLWVQDGRLKFRALKDAFPDELKELIRDNRDEIIRILQERKGQDLVTYPLSFNQQSLWFLHQITEQLPSYNVATACRIISDLDIDAVLYALNNLVKRHEVLRTTYYLSEETHSPMQRVLAHVDIPFEHIDASNWFAAEIKGRVENYYKKPFDLENGPVFRVYIFTRAKKDHIFLLTIHHIACDAWSLKILLDEFAQFYETGVRKKDLDLPFLPFQYKDFVSYQKEMLKSPFGEKALFYWKQTLPHTSSDLNSLSDFKRPMIQTYSGSSYFFNIEGELYQAIKQFKNENNATLYSMLLSVYQLLLMRLSGQKNVMVGTPAACRNRKEYREVCGYFINPVVISGDYRESMTFREYLSEVSKKVFDALDYQEYPFPMLVENLVPQRRSDVSPIFQVMFNLINRKMLGVVADFLCPSADSEPVRLGSLNILPFPISQQEGQYDQTLEIIDTDQFLFCVLKYNTDLFKMETIKKMVEDYQLLLRRVIKNQDSPLSECLNQIERKKAVVEQTDQKKLQLTVTATFTIELLGDTLEFWMKKLGISSDIAFAPYNQVFQQLLDPSSLISKNINGINLIFIRFDDWSRTNDSSLKTITQEHLENLKRNADEFFTAIGNVSSKNPTTFLAFFCPPSPLLMEHSGFSSMVKRIQGELIQKLNQMSGVYPIPFEEILAAYPVEQYYESMGEKIGHIPYTQPFFVALSTLAARKIYGVLSKPYKAIILDCDNTLWNGIIGEDGILGVNVAKDKKWLQMFALEQYNSGMLLCLCSKNNERDVLEVFEKHPDMILKMSHLAAHRINWKPKSENLKSLAQELHIGLDSFIFIDDNPLECAEVQGACPEVLTIQFPANCTDVSNFFENIWAFDHLKVTSEDKKRSQYYKDARDREQSLKEAMNFLTFIEGLNLNIQILEMQPSQIQRVSQLTQRTNQFNLTTIRRSESEIEKLMKTGHHKCYTVTVSDRFGEYGLVGVMITEEGSETLHVDTMLLSCRALGRGVEYRMLSHIGKLAEEGRFGRVTLNYIPTQKNMPVRDFLKAVAEKYGKEKGDGVFYDLPPAIAAKVKFFPDKPPAIPNDDKQKDEKFEKEANSGKPSNLDIGTLLLEIATELSDVDRIQGIVFPKKAVSEGAADPVMNKFDVISRITSVWREVLRMDSIDPNDNFFEVGGKSILIPLIVIQLKKDFNIEISIVHMLQYPTIKALADFITNNSLISTDNLKIQAQKQKDALSRQKQRAMMAKKMSMKNRH